MDHIAKVNKERLWKRVQKMGEIGKTPRGGVSRFAWTSEYKQAASLLIRWMEDLGMEVFVDTVGNVFGRFPGKKEKPPILTGSHLDTVPDGGFFDGMAGILCGLEAVSVMKEQGIVPECPIELVAFINEEASQFLGGCMGSKAICGKLPDDYGDTCIDRNTGKSLREAMEEYGMGLDADRISDSRRKKEDYTSFIEVHIEQGTYLLEQGLPVAIVDHIAGIRQFYMIFHGEAAHAGGMAMERRHDAFMAAAETACMLEKIVTETGTGARGTVGYAKIVPNEHNIIPSGAVISVDFREADDTIWEEIYKKLTDFAEQQCEKRGVTLEIRETLEARPCHCSRQLTGCMEQAAKDLDIACTHMVSYPAHDAMQMGDVWPVGMIFLRSSNGGLSHCPEEYTTPEDMETGANLLLHTLLRLADAG